MSDALTSTGTSRIVDRMSRNQDAPRGIIPQKPPPPPRREAPAEPLDPSDPPLRAPDEPTIPAVPPSQRPTTPRVEQHGGHGPRRGARRSFPPPPPDVEIIDRVARGPRDSEPLMLIGLGGTSRGARGVSGAAIYRSR